MRRWRLAGLATGLLFFLSAVPASAQIGLGSEISGYARAVGSQRPIPGLVVSLRTDGGSIIQQVTPEANGRFVFSDLRQGIYYVSAEAPGYREASQRADLVSTPRVSVFLNLQPDGRARAAAAEPPGAAVDQRELQVPPNALKEFEKGRKLLDGNEPEKSLSHFRKATEIFPSFATAYLFLGMANMSLRKWKDAEGVLNKAIELNDKMGPAYLALGACENEQGNFAAAEKPLVHGLELNPDTADGHFQLGKAYWALGHWQDAEPHARKALALRPDFPDAHLLMGNVNLQKRDPSSALVEFKEYLRLQPSGEFAAPTRDVVAKLEKALGPGH